MQLFRKLGTNPTAYILARIAEALNVSGDPFEQLERKWKACGVES